MADGRKNPLIGAFRTPVAETLPKASEPLQADEGKKSAAPPKITVDPKPPVADPGKPGEDKKPVEPPKAATDPKAPATAVPGKPSEDKKPVEPPKATTDPKAPAAADLGKSADGKKPVELSKTATDPKAPAAAAPGKSGEDKKPVEPPKAATDPKAPTAAAPGKPAEGKKPIEPPKAATDPKVPAAAAPGKPGEDKKPTEQPKVATDPKAPATADPGKPGGDKKPDEPPKAKDTEEEIPKDFKLPITKEGQSEIITTLKVSEIHPFEGHPFNVKDDKDMMDLVDSVKKFGVLEPVVVIPRKAGGYEMVSGHRRRRACELAGITTMPVIVRQLDRDEAVISMVDANLKRENISPMEKARAYAMKLEAMKHKAGRRTKEEVAAMEAAGKKPMRADEELAQQTGESRSNIQKLVRLNSLTPELQQMVEEKKLPVHTAADLSYLKKEEQTAVADAIKKEDKVPSGSQAVELKKASQEGKLTTEKIEKAVAPTKREETPPLKITLTEEDLRPYFPDKRTTIPDVKRGVFEALDLRKKALERQRAKIQAEKDPKKKSEPAR
ncbi:ParB/RepB/Spo0J family partition protein [Dysosmobacter sp. Sow4_B12]|uniref:ParB/RepB/Spo0J family partition protein n=1 Tax=Dysosmobacter sp. Sow4_B12 TaxID=3438777 RepID=UPI003F91E421